ncbi:MAG: riboflavin synthase [Elusimicrobiota bacterium]
MFTGIVKNIGKVEYIRGNKICIKSDLKNVELGDSVLVDGVCLTVAEKRKNRLIMDISLETLKTTALKNMKPGKKVNLETSLTLSDKIGGHFVYGHVMDVGKIISMKKVRNTELVTIKAGKKFIEKIFPKSSVAVNGVSLTVNEVGRDWFKLALIPETLNRTNLGNMNLSQDVNLEADMLVMKK